MINYIYIDNFKSLRNISLELPAFAHFCGPNGSGKSNFAEVLDLIGTTFRNGIGYAVADKGGFANMVFRRQRRSRGAITIQVAGNVKAIAAPLNSIEYRFSFSLQTKEEAIRSDFFVNGENYDFRITDSGGLISTVKVVRENGKYVFTSELSEAIRTGFPYLSNLEQWSELAKPQERELLYPTIVENSFPFDVITHQAASVRVFRISPRHAMQAGIPSVSGELGKYGDNLPSALDYMMHNDQPGFEQLQFWMKDVVPSLASLKADYTETKRLGLFLHEKGVGSPWYAEDLSDGTLMSLALFLAVLDKRHRVVFVEEPENSLHPWILKRFLECCKEVALYRQVFITTQSPFVVAHADPDRLFLIEKVDGRTEITNAVTREPDLKKIVKHDFLNLGEYWLSGGLRAVPEPTEYREEELFKDDGVRSDKADEVKTDKEATDTETKDHKD